MASKLWAFKSVPPIRKERKRQREGGGGTTSPKRSVFVGGRKEEEEEEEAQVLLLDAQRRLWHDASCNGLSPVRGNTMLVDGFFLASLVFLRMSESTFSASVTTFITIME